MPDTTALSFDEKIAGTRALLELAVDQFPPVAFASSFSAEDMILLEMIATSALDVEIFTLDTGRLNEETHTLIALAAERFSIPVRILSPESGALEDFTADHGANAFYRSIDLRQRCCDIRKIQPLKRALDGKGAWITGQRRQQSVTRATLRTSEWDAGNGLQKFNPLAYWSHKDVWAYIEREALPYNALHDQGYASIGCAPCTRAITQGEDERAGRWWWEDPDTKECGLHAVPGKATTISSTISGNRPT